MKDVRQVEVGAYILRHLQSFYILHFTFYILLSCTNLRTEVDPAELLGETEKLVVHSYLSPQDTILLVKVGRTKPVVGNQAPDVPYNVTNATVTLAGGGQSVQLTYLSSEQTYRARASALPIVTGRTYTLTATTPDGRRVTAQATIPPPVPIQGIRLDSVITKANSVSGSTSVMEWQKLYQMTLRWQDPPGAQNYYRYGATFAWNPIANHPIGGQPISLPVTLRAIAFQRENITDNLLTDSGLDSTVLSSLPSVEFMGIAVSASQPNAETEVRSLRPSAVFPGVRITAQLFHLDKAYYQYVDAVTRQRRNRSNPFAEPALIPTNIEGGLGCFAGYNQATLTVQLR
jgi:hypothetical protein